MLSRVSDLDELREHGHRSQQAGTVAHDHPRLPAISGDHHDRAALARSQMRTPVAERSKEHRDGGEDKRLATASPAHKPSFVRGLRRWRAAPGVTLIDRELCRRERQCEQRRKEHAPCCPAVAAKERGEHLLVVERAEDVHGTSSRSTGDLTRIDQRIGRHVTWAALQPDGFEQPPQAIRRALVEIEILGAGRASSSEPSFEMLQLDRENRDTARDRALGGTGVVGTAEVGRCSPIRSLARRIHAERPSIPGRKALPFVIRDLPGCLMVPTLGRPAGASNVVSDM